MVNEAVGAGRGDGPFVEALGVDLAPLQTGDLGADQCGAVLEILRACVRVDLKLPVVGDQSLPMLRRSIAVATSQQAARDKAP